jgi:hypothetical protein
MRRTTSSAVNIAAISRHLDTQVRTECNYGCLTFVDRKPCNVACVIPEIDIWRAATLMLKRYGDKALDQSRTRIDELAADGDHDGADTWRRITAAVEQLANTTPPGPLH